MQQRTILGCNWARGGEAGSGVVRRAHPASGAQWNVQVVRGKVNGKCLWNACKALSIGLLLMLLGGAMATIGYYAEDLSMAHEVRGNHTVKIKNESRGFHLNNLSYAGPIVMGVGGFIVVAACVMTFEARDSAAKVVPARLKSGSGIQCTHRSMGGERSAHGSLRTSASQTGVVSQQHSSDRHAVTQSFVQFSKGLVIDNETRKSTNLLRVSQSSISKSPSAPDLTEQKLATVGVHQNSKKASPMHQSCKEDPRKVAVNNSTILGLKQDGVSRTLTSYGALNPKLLHRHALSVDETAHTYRLSHESLQGTGSQCSMALDLHLECPVTLRIRDRRRNPLRRQCKIEAEDEKHLHEQVARSNSHSPRMSQQYRTKSNASGSPGLSPSSTFCGQRRSSNASDCTHRARTRRKDCHHQRGRLERAISSDSRLTGVHHKCHHHHHHHVQPQVSVEDPTLPGVSTSETDITHTRTHYPKT